MQSVAPTITKVDQGAPVTPSSPAVKVDDDVNNDTGTHFYFVVHNPSNATTDDTFTFPITTSDGTYTIPQEGTLELNGQDAKMLVADYAMDGQHLVYSTSEIMTHFAQGSQDVGSQDVALLYGRDGEDGETVLPLYQPADRERRLGQRVEHLRPHDRRRSSSTTSTTDWSRCRSPVAAARR